jgi:hypothetical protein
MTREDLRERLDGELAAWRARSFEEVSKLKYPFVYDRGERGQPGYYSTEVLVLESSAEGIHLSISVDDGRLSAFVPVSGSVTIASSDYDPRNKEGARAK